MRPPAISRSPFLARSPLLVALLLAFVASAFPAVAPARAAEPVVPASPPNVVSAARSGFALTLREPADFVTQYTDVACVGASVQMMLNMMRPGGDRTRTRQANLLRSAQKVSNRVFVRRLGGASAFGWAYALERAGGGPYRVRAYATRDRALRAVVKAIRSTGRPAGLLVWAGAHAWVVGGFRATADPLRTSRYRITGLVLDDPWWPRATSSHGPPRRPGSVLSPAELAQHFVRFQRGPRRGGSVMNGSFVVVLPIDPAEVRERARGML